MPLPRPLGRLLSVLPDRDREFGCQRRTAPHGYRCPNTYMERAARAADHLGYCSEQCAEAAQQQQRRRAS